MLPQPVSVQVFEDESQAVLTQLSAAFRDAIESIPSAAGLRPQDLSRELSLTKNLAWQVHNVAYATDPFAIVEYIPGPQGITIFLTALHDHGADEAKLKAAKDAVQRYNAHAKQHGQGRAGFEKIASALSDESLKRATLKYRKSAFEANSYLFGAQADVQIRTSILRPCDANPGMLDCAVVRGFHKLTGVRPGDTWLMARTRWVQVNENAPIDITRTPIFTDDDEVPLMRKYCSPTDLRTRTVKHNDIIDHEILDRGLGTTGEITCFSGELIQGNLTRYSEPGEDPSDAMLGTWVYTPCKLLVVDQFQHRDIEMPTHPEPRMVSAIENTTPYSMPMGHRAMLPVPERVEFLRKGVAMCGLDELPGYADMIADVCQSTGWDADELVLYRLRIPFPPVPVSVLIKFGLPLPPETA